MPVNTPIPIMGTGTVLTQSELGTLIPLNTSIGLFGTASGVAGTPPAASAPNWLMQGGFFAGTTSGIGVLNINFPVPFPNGVLVVVGNNGDNAAVANIHFDFLAAGYSTSSCQAVAWNDGSTQNSTPVRINYIAIGW